MTPFQYNIYHLITKELYPHFCSLNISLSHVTVYPDLEILMLNCLSFCRLLFCGNAFFCRVLLQIWLFCLYFILFFNNHLLLLQARFAFLIRFGFLHLWARWRLVRLLTGCFGSFNAVCSDSVLCSLGGLF